MPEDPMRLVKALGLVVLVTAASATIWLSVASLGPSESIGTQPTQTHSDAATAEEATAETFTSAPAPTAVTTTAVTTTVSPPMAAAPMMGLWATGDIGDCYSGAPAEVANLIQQRPGHLVALGDLAYPSGTLDQFQSCFAEPFINIIDRIIPVVGNHEYETPDAQGWKSFFGQTDTYYAQTLSPDWLLIVVDTECNLIGACGPEDPQQQWLTQTLATAPRCVIVAAHRPYRTSQNDYDRESRSEHIHNITINHNADILLTGHAHFYEHINYGTTQQFTVGTGGAGLRTPGNRVQGSTSALAEHGALYLTLTPTDYSWEFLDTSGSALHSGTNTCN